MRINKILRQCTLPCAVAAVLLGSILPVHAGGSFTVGNFTNTPVVVVNNTGVDESNVWVTFIGGFSTGTNITDNTVQTYGATTFQSAFSNSSIAVNKSVPLSDLLSPVTAFNSTSTLFGGTPAYNFQLNNFVGRVYFSFGGNLNGASPAVPMSSNTANTLSYSFFEPAFIGPNSSNPSTPAASNGDISYVDGVFSPITLAVYNTNGTIQQLNNTNPVVTHSNILQNVASVVPAAALVYNGTTLVGVNSSKSDPSAYHDWTNLMTTLQTNNTTLYIGNYTAPNQGNLTPLTLSTHSFGFGTVGNGGNTSGQGTNFLNGQGYSANATYTANLNPNGDDANLTALGIGNGTSGVKITGYGITDFNNKAPAGNFTIYITSGNLNGGNGMYGENPGYVVSSDISTFNATSNTTTVAPGYYATAGVINDLGGRVVGDLTQSTVWGWANSTTNIAAHATATGTDLKGIAFSSSTVGGLTTGEFFMLLSLASSQGKLSDWIGANIDGNADDYDAYEFAISQNSDAYGTGFGDRLGGLISPDLSWYTANPPANPFSGNIPPDPFDTVGYVQLTLGGTAVPEPATFALLLSGGALISTSIYRFLSRKRKSDAS